MPPQLIIKINDKYLNSPMPQWGFSGPVKPNDEHTCNMVKNPNWWEADQLAIYKHGRGVEPKSTTQLQLSGQSGT